MPNPDRPELKIEDSWYRFARSFLKYMLNVSRLNKRFGDLAIFENFDLKLSPNGFTVLIDKKVDVTKVLWQEEK